MAAVDAARAVAGLQELRRLTGDADGAQRVAWTETWIEAREWLRAELDLIDGVTLETDEAGNTWASAPGDHERFVIVGGHLDSVPDGGWLDGTLNVVGGLEVLRALAHEPRGVGLKLVDWADEEGARFGRSLLGSSACAGTLDPDAVRWPPTASRSSGCANRARGSTARPPTSSCTSSRVPCSSAWSCRWA
jgi:allantoate deiminase